MQPPTLNYSEELSIFFHLDMEEIAHSLMTSAHSKHLFYNSTFHQINGQNLSVEILCMTSKAVLQLKEEFIEKL